MSTDHAFEIHLEVRVKPGQRAAFLAFLREAFAFYQSPGGIRMRLLEDIADDHRFVEVVGYDTEADYLKDQQRVESDPEMGRWLAQWREFLCAPPGVQILRALNLPR